MERPYFGTIGVDMADEQRGVRQPVWWRLQTVDVAWLLLFCALALASPYRVGAELQLLTALAVSQLAEPRIVWLSTRRGSSVALCVKFLLAYLLVGVTGGVASSYYLILMIPVVSTVSAREAPRTALVSLAACGAYLSFLLWIDWDRYELPEDQMRELVLRVLSFAVVALLMQQLAVAYGRQARRSRETAEELVAANRRLADAQDVARRSERLAALGQLTAGLAHELRNPMGTMKASAEILLKQLPADQPVARELAGYIRDEVDRTNSLVTRFLDFARPLELRRSPVDLNELIDRAIDRIERRDPPIGVSIHRNYSPDVSPLPLDAELMERVFYNLLLNAAEASTEGDPVTVKTRPVPGGAEASVIDRGVGIDPAQLESVFNPFFTTKPAGTGLGLAIVSKIVDQHGGRIGVESEPGQGTVFRIVLPSGSLNGTS
jgi:signal transduction histidine kinase